MNSIQGNSNEIPSEQSSEIHANTERNQSQSRNDDETVEDSTNDESGEGSPATIVESDGADLSNDEVNRNVNNSDENQGEDTRTVDINSSSEEQPHNYREAANHANHNYNNNGNNERGGNIFRELSSSVRSLRRSILILTFYCLSFWLTIVVHSFTYCLSTRELHGMSIILLVAHFGTAAIMNFLPKYALNLVVSVMDDRTREVFESQHGNYFIHQSNTNKLHQNHDGEVSTSGLFAWDSTSLIKNRQSAPLFFYPRKNSDAELERLYDAVSYIISPTYHAHVIHNDDIHSKTNEEIWDHDDDDQEGYLSVEKTQMQLHTNTFASFVVPPIIIGIFLLVTIMVFLCAHIFLQVILYILHSSLPASTSNNGSNERTNNNSDNDNNENNIDLNNDNIERSEDLTHLIDQNTNDNSNNNDSQVNGGNGIQVQNAGQNSNIDGNEGSRAQSPATEMNHEESFSSIHQAWTVIGLLLLEAVLPWFSFGLSVYLCYCLDGVMRVISILVLSISTLAFLHIGAGNLRQTAYLTLQNVQQATSDT